MTDQTTNPAKSGSIAMPWRGPNGPKSEKRSEQTLVEPSKSMVWHQTPSSELKTPTKTAKLVTTSSYLGNIG